MSERKKVVLHLVGDAIEAEREVRFPGGSFGVRFRPVSPAAHRACQRRVAAAADADGQAAAEAELLAGVLVDWELATEDGGKQPITADVLRRLPQEAFNALYAEVVLYTGARVLGNSAAS